MPRHIPLNTEEEAYEAAVALLARKARSAHEVARELVGRGADETVVESVLGRLRSHRHLDDAVLAEDQAFALVEGKGVAPAAAVDMLVERGISGPLARESVAVVQEGRSETALCRAVLERRTKGAPLDRAAVAREARALARLGYAAEVVQSVLERFQE